MGYYCSRHTRWSPEQTAGQLDDLEQLVGRPLELTPKARQLTAELAAKHKLTFYDAAFAAVAKASQVPLATTDKQLLKLSTAKTPSQLVDKFGLTETV